MDGNLGIGLEPRRSKLAQGQSIFLSTSISSKSSLKVLDGIARVYCPCEETADMTLAFIQSGDQLETEKICSDGVCLEALTTFTFISQTDEIYESIDAVNEWTLQLLRIRHLTNSEQRLQALFALLVTRLGKRCGNWCKLPFRLTHERIGELIGSTRVTSTRLISRLKAAHLLHVPSEESSIYFAPEFIEASSLSLTI